MNNYTGAGTVAAVETAFGTLLIEVDGRSVAADSLVRVMQAASSGRYHDVTSIDQALFYTVDFASAVLVAEESMGLRTPGDRHGIEYRYGATGEIVGMAAKVSSPLINYHQWSTLPWLHPYLAVIYAATVSPALFVLMYEAIANTPSFTEDDMDWGFYHAFIQTDRHTTDPNKTFQLLNAAITTRCGVAIELYGYGPKAERRTFTPAQAEHRKKLQDLVINIAMSSQYTGGYTSTDSLLRAIISAPLEGLPPVSLASVASNMAKTLVKGHLPLDHGLIVRTPFNGNPRMPSRATVAGSGTDGNGNLWVWYHEDQNGLPIDPQMVVQ